MARQTSMGMRLQLDIVVDLPQWELSYGIQDDIADLKEDVKAHVSATVEEAVRRQFELQANGSELKRVTIIQRR